MTNDINQLLEILTFRRKNGSDSEAMFIERFIKPLNPTTYTAPSGETLAYVVKVGESDTMMSCHTDSVHRTDGMQSINYDTECQLVYKPESKDDTECLGADDGAGVWLLLQMIEARVPGTYVFHRAEEVGGVGSRGMASYYANFLQQFQRAIAFDRRGTGDVITHQAWGRCCSDEFAEHLSTLFNASGLDYKPCDGGIFTDTANYVTLIPECTNISCGYDSEHGPGETLDVEHLVKLRDACISIEWDSLITARDPSVVEDDRWGGYSWPYSSHSEPVRDFAYAETSDVMEMSFSKLVAWVRKQDAETVAEVMLDLIDRVYMLEDEADVAAHEAYETEEVSPFDRRM